MLPAGGAGKPARRDVRCDLRTVRRGLAWRGRRAVRRRRCCAGPGVTQPTRAVADESDDVVEGWVVAQFDVVVAGDVEGFPDAGEDFGLLDGVDAEVGLEVEFQVEHVRRVAGLVGDDFEHLVGDRVAHRGRGGRG